MNRYERWTNATLIAGLMACTALSGCKSTAHRTARSPLTGLESDRNVKLTAKQIADLKVAMGRAHEKRGDEEQARIVYEEALKQDPKRHDACMRLAILNDKQGKFREAETMYKKALAIKPGDTDTYCNMGYSLYLQKRWSDAEMNLRQAIALDGNHARSHNNLGLVLVQTSTPQAALAEFLKAGCEEHEAQLNVAYGLTMKNDLTEAAAYYQLARQNPATREQGKKGLQLIQAVVRAAGPGDVLPAAAEEEESEAAPQAAPVDRDDRDDAADDEDEEDDDDFELRPPPREAIEDDEGS